MKLLITGGTTFVSKAAAAFFIKNGDEVTVLNRGSREQVGGVRLLQCDRMALGDRLRGERFDAVLDITAYTQEHVLALLDSGVQFDDYVLVSSSAVYPETNPQPFREEQACGCNSIWKDYGLHKLQAETVLRERVPGAYILRPPYFYGIYENLYREAFVFDCALRGRAFYLPGDGSQKLQFFHVEDFCRFVRILLQQHPQERIYNVGNPETVTVKEWVQLCYRAAGTEARFVSVPKTVPQREYFCFYDYEYVLDVSRQSALLKDTLPLWQGLREEFTWYRDRPDSVYFRKPYLDYIDRELKNR